MSVTNALLGAIARQLGAFDDCRQFIEALGAKVLLLKLCNFAVWRQISELLMIVGDEPRPIDAGLDGHHARNLLEHQYTVHKKVSGQLKEWTHIDLTFGIPISVL